MKIVFFGSDDFALMSLRALIKDNFSIAALVTQPDRARGRGMKVVTSVIKDEAITQNISVLQPEDIRDEAFIGQLKDFQADLFIVIAYGRILPADILDIPVICSLNVHASLLPKYRGAAPINWAIMKGETETGVSLIKMNTKMDAGEILVSATAPINDNDTAGDLRHRLAELGAAVLTQLLPNIEQALGQRIEQDESAVSFAPKLTREIGRIDWSQSAGELDLLIRGLNPQPSAFTLRDGKMLKILSAEYLTLDHQQKPGTVIEVTAEGFIVGCGKNALFIKEVKPESAKAMTARAYLAGKPLVKGYCFTGI